MPTPVFASATNGWIPSWDATGQVIAFVRDPKEFKIREYVSFRPAKKMVGVYLELDSANFVRVTTDDEYGWADGGERPSGNENQMGFFFTEYSTKRRDFPVTSGNLSLAQTPWPLMAINTQMVMSQAMVSLTRRIRTVLEATANWGTNFATATALGGGLWGSATSANPYIKKTINQVVLNILLSTYSRVKPDQIRMSLPPIIAKAVTETDEYRDYLKQSPVAMAEVRGDAPNKNVLFGLPNKLYGVDTTVEDASVETARRGATSALAFVADPNKVVFTTKQEVVGGDTVGDDKKEAFPNFSTFQVFYYGEDGSKTDETGAGELVVEQWADVRNKRTEVHAVQNTCEQMVANRSGYLVTNVLS